jgi:hypothetical protein
VFRETLTILELKSARQWSLTQTARAFLITTATISCWLRRLDEEGADALVQMQQPVNRFPDYITYIVKKLRQLCPTMGKKKISETLAKAGLHLGTTTIGRMLKRKPRHLAPAPDPHTEKKVVLSRSNSATTSGISISQCCQLAISGRHVFLSRCRNTALLHFGSESSSIISPGESWA